MFAAKKAKPANRRNHDLSQFGLTEIPDDFDPSGGYGDNDSNDSDLEAELAAIAGGKMKPKPKPKRTVLATSELDKMVAASLQDVDSDGDDEGDVENDSDLLGELENITGEDLDLKSEDKIDKTENTSVKEEAPALVLPTTALNIADVIRQRIEMYKQAETNAKASGDAAKARRFARGLKTLMDLLKQANAGKLIKIEDMPPEISVKTLTPASPSANIAEDTAIVPTRAAPAPPPPNSSSSSSISSPVSRPVSSPVKSEPTVSEPTPIDENKNPLIEQMRSRQIEYKAAALQSKRDGDTAMALQFLKVVKQFDLVMKMCIEGQEVDLSDMPPPPGEFKEFLAKMQGGVQNPAPATESSETTPKPVQPVVASGITPASMLEALNQRLDKYKSVEESAKSEGNASKARRFGRIVKQYEDAIKLYKANRPVAYDELPIPPGFGPLPVENTTATAVAPTPTSPSPASSASGGASVSSESSSTGNMKGLPPQRQELTTRTSGNQHKNNIAEQQMKLLLERRKEFKLAALEAKKAGEIDQAKEYLKIYKGFESVLNAASSGLPVDLSTLPLPPSQRENLEASFAIVSTEECDPDDDISDIGVRVEEQLAKQLMMCKNTRDHHRAMGDVAGMNRFENLAVIVQKDLDLVRFSKRKNFPLPKFHYENRSFNIVHCNTDLNDTELEIMIVRGINYKAANPKDVDTYVKVEFPLLNDETYKNKTPTVKDTDSPNYEQRFKVEIQRNNRQFQRIFKRHGVKFEVYSRGGFLRSDTLIGTVNVKLQPLETKCDIHDTFDLMEGRRPIGGKLEIKLRVRNPLMTKQVEHINEKWLVLDS